MNEFSGREAWSNGVAFLSADIGRHLLILLGIGVAAPWALRLLVTAAATGGDPLGQLDPFAEGAGLAPGLAEMAGYALQIGSLFAAWRLGLGRGERTSGALRYGLLAGIMIAGGLFLVGALLGAASLAVSPALAALAIMMAVMLSCAVFLTLVAAFAAVAVALLLTLAIVLGGATGNLGFAATLVGGSGLVVVLLIAVSGATLWLAARLSCTTAIMAERRSFNPFAAMAESWRLTWDEEWRILRYLALLGLVAALAVGAAAWAIGLGAQAAYGGSVSTDRSSLLVGMGLAAPLVLVTMLVPAGLYRQLAGAPAPVEVFA